MGDFTLLAANCFVPCNKVDMELTINTIKRMPGFLRLKQFDELEKNKHAPEDDEHIWVCAVYKVRDEEVATIIRVLRALPYCQTLWLPDNAFVKDEMLELRHHPRFQAAIMGILVTIMQTMTLRAAVVIPLDLAGVRDVALRKEVAERGATACLTIARRTIQMKTRSCTLAKDLEETLDTDRG